MPCELASDEELLRYSERATETIMEVFEDPLFREGANYAEMELEEVDF
jgi:hypothetical protein